MAQLKDLLVSGAARFLNGLNVNGDFILAGNLLPAETNKYNIGSSDLKWKNLYGTRLSINGGDINTYQAAIVGKFYVGAESLFDDNVGIGIKPATKLHINGGKILYQNDGSLAIYTQDGGQNCGNETVIFQTCFDNQDPQTSSYVTSYENRCNLLLQPRGGQVYIGWNKIGAGDTNYSLLVNGGANFNDGNVTLGNGGGYFRYRTAPSLESGFYFHTNGRESVVFANEYAHTGWIFANGIKPSDRKQWNALGVIPAVQIHHNALYINRAVRDADTSDYNLYVNGSSNLHGNTFIYGDLSGLYDITDQYLQYTAEGTVASHAAKISLYRIIASGTAGKAGTKVPGVQLDAATGMLHLQAAASDPSASAGARIKFTYWNAADSNGQPVYISHVINDSYRAPYGLKIWGSDGTAPGAWLEVEGNLHIGSASNSNSNDNAALYIRGMSAIEGHDSWLRLNDNSSFTSGTYSPKLIRSDEALQVGSGGANFYANSSGNGYIQNTFGVHGTDTTKHFFVNGTSRFADDITMDSGSEILFSTNTQYLRWTTDTSNNNSTGRSWYGIGTYQNTSDSNNSWLNISNYLGINITTKGTTYLRHNNNIIATTGNQTGTVGSATRPIYSSGGVLVASSATVGSGVQPIYLASGNITASTSTVGSAINPIFMSAGRFSASTASIGNGVRGIYLSAGAITPMSYELRATVNSGTANRVSFYSGSNQISSANGLYTTGGNLGINATTTTANSINNVLYVNGPSYFNGQVFVGSKLKLWSDGEGGNIRFITSGNENNIFELDTCSNVLRLYYCTDGGTGATGFQSWTWGTDGSFTAKQFNGYLNGNAASATKLATARSIRIGNASKTFNGTANISYTPYEMGLVRALYNTDSNLNAFANRGHALGMCDLADNGSVDNPGGKTGWHHVINLTWIDTTDNNNNTTNEWCTQIANACGSSDLYVRSRGGGSITNGTAWVAPWTKILTDANYGSIADNRYVKKSGDTMTGALNLANGTWNKAGDDAQFGDNNTAGSFAIQGINGDTNLKMVTYGNTSYGTITWNSSQFVFSHGISTTGNAANTNPNNAAIEVRECGRVGNTQTSNAYAPRLGFHWGNRWWCQLALQDGRLGVYDSAMSNLFPFQASQVYGAVWNDYAEYRLTHEQVQPGHAVYENGDGSLSETYRRLQPGVSIISDTFGFAIGETNECKTPLAVSGRVLAYPYEDRHSYDPGDAVCSGPNGTISKMTREEIREYPDRIVGIVSEIPEYEVWGTGKVKVNGRIWIKVR